MSHIVVIDGMNFLHRARAGWTMGPAPVIFNFMRNFRSIVEQLNPTRIYFVLEGKPCSRREAYDEYKANRVIEPGSPAAKEREKFFKQSDEIVSLLKSIFPISVVRHPAHECDDTIYNLIKRSSRAVDWTVVSNDTDFIQLLNEFENVRIWNTTKKCYVKTPDYDYVIWKSLRGDSSDNIPGVPGVGDKTADSLVKDPQALLEFLCKSNEVAEVFLRNHGLIKFIEWSDEECLAMTSSVPVKDWSQLRSLFEQYSFESLLKEDTWNKFIATFDSLWGF